MKKLLALVLVLGMASIGMASVANAAFLISVNGEVDPPDTSIELLPSEYAIIDIHTDGTVPNPADMWLICEGPGVFESAGTLNPDVPWAAVAETMLFTLGDGSDIVEWLSGDYIAITSTVYPNFVLGAAGELPAGMLLDEVLFHCEDYGEVLLTLVSADLGIVYDTQIIHQIPEPLTLSLLSLGGLGLLRRRRA